MVLALCACTSTRRMPAPGGTPSSAAVPALQGNGLPSLAPAALPVAAALKPKAPVAKAAAGFAPLVVLDEQPHGPVFDVDLVTPDSAEALAPAARAAFARFLKLSAPRAFVTNADGVMSYASGADAIQRALRKCTERAGAAARAHQRTSIGSGQGPSVGKALANSQVPDAPSCHIFAVDDMLVSARSCRAGLAAARPGEPPSAWSTCLQQGEPTP